MRALIYACVVEICSAFLHQPQNWITVVFFIIFVLFDLAEIGEKYKHA